MILAILVLSIALIPLYQVFVRSWRTTRESKYSYLAMQVAREAMEEIRQVPLDRLIQDQALPEAQRRVLKKWIRAEGSLFPLSFLGEQNEVRRDAALRYPPDYRRIQVWLELAPPSPADGRMMLLTCDVKWEEAGAGSEHPSPRLGHFETLLVDHHVERETAPQ